MAHPLIQPGDTVTDAQVLRIYDGLRACRLPEPEWTHGAHLCAGTAFLHDLGLHGAEAAMPGVIRAYNESIGSQNTDNAGYHHTITLFYLRALGQFLEGRFGENIGALASAVLNSPTADRAFPLKFYSKDVLFSVAARRDWVAPDINASGL